MIEVVKFTECNYQIHIVKVFIIPSRRGKLYHPKK